MLTQIPRCNCPDAIHKQAGNPTTRYVSKLVDTDWSDGFTGIREEGGYCIHELAVLRNRKEIELAFPDGIPQDIPAPIPYAWESEAKETPETPKLLPIPEVPPVI